MDLLTKHLKLQIPEYQNKDFSENSTWQQNFQAIYKFRSCDDEWFAGLTEQSDDVLAEALKGTLT